jgi:hypothetical protein
MHQNAMQMNFPEQTSHAQVNEVVSPRKTHPKKKGHGIKGNLQRKTTHINPRS